MRVVLRVRDEDLTGDPVLDSADEKVHGSYYSLAMGRRPRQDRETVRVHEPGGRPRQDAGSLRAAGRRLPDHGRHRGTG
ncbi:hypothetical protein GCM10023336_22570 [Streptomyces similanensis]|uniref:Uncharacterized protein n=1 Tax=Streptomyces similanensis TaxID=1274988 RepID=A0ABP9K9K7_9ACTN